MFIKNFKHLLKHYFLCKAMSTSQTTAIRPKENIRVLGNNTAGKKKKKTAQNDKESK